MSRLRRSVVAFLAVLLLAGLVRSVPAAAERAPASGPARAAPASVWQGWQSIGVPVDPFLRDVVADYAELDEDHEVREAAQAALDAFSTESLEAFMATGIDQAKARASTRKAGVARQHREQIEAMAGTGGAIFNAEVVRVLAGTDGDRADFLAFGAEIARKRDEQTQLNAEARAKQLRDRVRLLVATGGLELRKAAQAALDAGDAAIAAFFATGGYEAAVDRDVQAREALLEQQRQQREAAEKLSALAKRAKQAWDARRNLLIAHGNGVNALRRAANAMTLAANESRTAAQILAAHEAGGAHPPEAFNEVKREVARQVDNTRQAATDAEQAAVTAQAQADILVGIDLPYGAQWARMAQGMHLAAQAAGGAAETAQHTIEATASTDAARDAQEKAQRSAEQAAKWRQQAEQHAAAAARVAESAQSEANAAKDAATRARDARISAEQTARQAWAEAAKAREQRNIAQQEAGKAAEARKRAEQERGTAAQQRAEAEKQAAVAKTARGNAERQADVAHDARLRAEGQEGDAKKAADSAETEERKAAAARDRSFVAEQARQAAEAKQQALDAGAAAARGKPYEPQAKAAAEQARQEAVTATNAATQARNEANTATYAAVQARTHATEASRAAARARAAANEAWAAYARADAAASKAEVHAANAHALAMRTDQKAAEATSNEVQAAEHANAAVQLSQQAAVEAQQALFAAGRTKAEADAAAQEAVSAATQAEVSIRAAAAARASSNGIAQPANTAITIVAPFTGEDLGADFAAEVARQAGLVGEEQARQAESRATEAKEAVRLAQEAADRASAEVKPAYDAAAASARSAAAAAHSAAEAQRAAADAAAQGVLARAAAASANDADRQAQDDARLARDAANAAWADATIAGRAADDAAREAAAADQAAGRAEADADAARRAADRAEADASAARQAAENARKDAERAAEMARNAVSHATEAQQSADRAEEQRRRDEEELRRRQAQQAGDCLAELTTEQADDLASFDEGSAALVDHRKIRQECFGGGDVLAYLAEVGADVLLEVIGVNDAIRCFGDGNIASCLWTVVNVLSLATIFTKLVPIGKAIVSAVTNIGKYLAKSERIQKIAAKVESIIQRVNKICPVRPRVPAMASAGGSATASGPHAVPSWLCDPLPNLGTYDELVKELAVAERLGVTPIRVGTAEFDALVETGEVMKWAVMQDGTLSVVPKSKNGEEIKHTVISRGHDVASAGEARVTGSSRTGYVGVEINLQSGHYIPPRSGSLGRAYLRIGKDAFAEFGVFFR